MFTIFNNLPCETRFQIWEYILHSPRTVHITMRLLSCSNSGAHPLYQCLSRTPVPVLLHVCRETRKLALSYYELTFGKDQSLDVFGGRIGERPPSPTPVLLLNPEVPETEEDKERRRKEEEVRERENPRVYFRFERDTVVFGLMEVLDRHAALVIDKFTCTRHAHRQDFPYGPHFGTDVFERIQRMGICLYDSPGRSMWMLDNLNYHAGICKYKALKDLYLCLEDSLLDTTREVEIVDVLGGERGVERGVGKVMEMTPEMAGRWKAVFMAADPPFDPETGIEGLRSLCKVLANRQRKLTASIMGNGPERNEVLKCGLITNKSG